MSFFPCFPLREEFHNLNKKVPFSCKNIDIDSTTRNPPTLPAPLVALWLVEQALLWPGLAAPQGQRDTRCTEALQTPSLMPQDGSSTA